MTEAEALGLATAAAYRCPHYYSVVACAQCVASAIQKAVEEERERAYRDQCVMCRDKTWPFVENETGYWHVVDDGTDDGALLDCEARHLRRAASLRAMGKA